MKNKIIYVLFGMFLIVSCSNITTTKKETNLNHLMIKNDVEKTLDSINVKQGIVKYLYVFDLYTKSIFIKDSVETPILFNDLDSSLYMNSRTNNVLMLELIKDDSTKIIFSDSILIEKDIIENTKSFVVF